MKVVINACYGGFSLSSRAIKAYCDRKGIPCHFFIRDGFKGPYTRITDKKAFAAKGLFRPSAFRCETPEEIPSQDNFIEMTQEERAASSKAYEAISVPYDRDIARDDADLIAVVGLLGQAANGACAQLRIVEIPDGVNWQIEEYDGNEHVAEAHSTWN